MGQENRFLAIDLGAESGRGILATLCGGKIAMQELHRWSNRPVRLAGTLYWDFPCLFAEMLHTMCICAERGLKVSGIGVDTWGVDFGLLAADGSLLSNPVHYRDHRTDSIHQYSDAIMPRQEIFAETGYEPWPISSLFQLLSMQRDGSDILGIAKTFLNMPDLFNYFLTGRKANERSIANTSNIMATNGLWSRAIIEQFGLPEMFGELIEPASVLGPLQPPLADAVGLGDLPVIAVCGHDTSSAVAAVPAEGENWAFLSCGTWSVLGTLIDKPVTTPQCLQQGYTNEYTLGGWYLARNILGLWLLQELHRKWDTSSDPWDYARMTDEAAAATGFAGLLNVADESLLAPADMELALGKVLAEAGQGSPQTRGQLIRCVLESLALEYAWGMDAIAELTGKQRDRLYLVGGGSANQLLCQFTANACDVIVHAGAQQCTAMGNALCQARALGILSENHQVRQVLHNSAELRTYEPQEQALWKEKRNKYRSLRKSAEA